MSLFNKSDLVCKICQRILDDPIHLPCFCTICKAHLQDKSVKNGTLSCESCGDTFDVENLKVRTNTHVKIIVEANEHLTQQEKDVKRDIQACIQTWSQLYAQFVNELNYLETNSHEHFTELRRQIDIHREQLTQKIDQIALDMIEKTKQVEASFQQNFNEFSASFSGFDAVAERNKTKEEFRNVNLLVDNLKQLHVDNQAKCVDIQVKLSELNQIKGDIKSCQFDAVSNSSFGSLKLAEIKQSLVSCSFDKTLKIWKVGHTNDCVQTKLG